MAEGLADEAQARGALELKAGVSATAQGIQSGELFQYAIKIPVTLSRQKSAMLPIISQDVKGEKVSIYNQGVQPKYPLNGFLLKNSTPLYLMQGPITVFDEGAYAGDARIEDIAPGQERLLSYAIDLKTEVEPLNEGGQQDLVTVKLRKGTLIATRRASEATTYNLRNRDRKKKVVLIEHPFRADWQLKQPSETAERSRDTYRFPITVDAGKSARLRVREEKQFDEAVQITNMDSDAIGFYLHAREVSSRVKSALQEVVRLRDRLNQTVHERERRLGRIEEIGKEQARIRENMTRLAQNSELYTRYVKKLDQQETEIENLRQEIEKIQATEVRQSQELNEYLLKLEVD
jgi:hypothetical protein